MKQINPAGDLQRLSAIVSFDAHLEAVAQGELLVFEIQTENHPRLSPGDILFVDTVPLETCDDKELLLIDFDTEYVLRQKKFVKSIFRRSGIHIVGAEKRERVHLIGRVIGWLHAKEA